jgi:hypothetical protein
MTESEPWVAAMRVERIDPEAIVDVDEMIVNVRVERRISPQLPLQL